MNAEVNVPTNEWLEKINEQFNAEDMPPQRRAMEAMRRWTIEHQISIAFGDDRAEKIQNWFKLRVKSELQQIGSIFKGIFYFESAFYSVYFPVSVGTQALDIWQFLKDMPEQIKVILSTNEHELKNYKMLCADGLDYILGYGEAIVMEQKITIFA